MNLEKLECPLAAHLAEELSFLLEDQALAISWYEKDSQEWIFQAICKANQERSLRTKMTAFFKEKDLSLPKIITSPLPQEDWVTAVHRDFPPLTIGQFYIHGSHHQEVPPADLIPLCINAATAFGSGQHESTEGCLKALSLLAEQKTFKFPLDMGCGSGILALAMAQLWKAPVLACDCDPEAIRVTGENARINHLEERVNTCISEGFSALQGKTFDIITANILAEPLRQMASDAVHTLLPGGIIVLAGLLTQQAEDVMEAYQNVGTKLMTQLFIGDWSTLIMRKESHG